MDDTFIGFNTDATISDDSQCGDPIVIGCMDSNSLTYNASANVADTTLCEFEVCGDEPDGTGDDPFNYVCDTPPYGLPQVSDNPADDNYVPDLSYLCDANGPMTSVYNIEFNDSICLYPIAGCMDPDAFNYDGEEITVDDGSCVPFIYGCPEEDALNYYCDNPNVLYNGVMMQFPCSGGNFPSNFVPNPSSCDFPDPVLGCTDSTALNYNPLADTDDATNNYY